MFFLLYLVSPVWIMPSFSDVFFLKSPVKSGRPPIPPLDHHPLFSLLETFALLSPRLWKSVSVGRSWSFFLSCYPYFDVHPPLICFLFFFGGRSPHLVPFPFFCPPPNKLQPYFSGFPVHNPPPPLVGDFQMWSFPGG